MQSQDSKNDVNVASETSSSDEKGQPRIIRVIHNRENPFVQLNKKALWDENLSLKAVGLWARCMSRPNDWKFSIKELCKTGKEGRRAIDSAMQELIEQGYAIRVEYYERDKNGQFIKGMGGMEYVFFEFQATPEEKQEQFERFKKSFRNCGFGDSRNGDSRNAHLLNIDKETIDRKDTKPIAPPKGAAKDLPSFSEKSIKPKKLKKSFDLGPFIERAADNPLSAKFTEHFGCPLVGISDADHDRLVKKYGTENTDKFYKFFASWKISKAAAEPKDLFTHIDIARIEKWVIKEVLENQSSMPGSYKRTGKLAIEADKTAMAKLQTTGTSYIDADEFAKKILEDRERKRLATSNKSGEQ